MGFVFRDTYKREMTPKRKKYEDQNRTQELEDLLTGNLIYQNYQKGKSELDAQIALCEESSQNLNIRLEDINGTIARYAARIADNSIENAIRAAVQQADACNDTIQGINENTALAEMQVIDAADNSACNASSQEIFDTELPAAITTISGEVADTIIAGETALDTIANDSDVSYFNTQIDAIESNSGNISVLSGEVGNLVTDMADDTYTAGILADLETIFTAINGSTSEGQLKGDLAALQSNVGTAFNSLVANVSGALNTMVGNGDIGGIVDLVDDMTTIITENVSDYTGPYNSVIQTAVTSATNSLSNAVSSLAALQQSSTNTNLAYHESEFAKLVQQTVEKYGALLTYDYIVNANIPFDVINAEVLSNYT